MCIILLVSLHQYSRVPLTCFTHLEADEPPAASEEAPAEEATDEQHPHPPRPPRPPHAAEGATSHAEHVPAFPVFL